MIIKFTNFLNEFYTGPFSAAGFKLHEPSNKFNFNLNIKYKPENEELIKNILAKYDIPYDELNFKKQNRRSQKLDLTFLSYNRLEAVAIINSILSDLAENSVTFDKSSVKFKEIDDSQKGLIGFNRINEPRRGWYR